MILLSGYYGYRNWGDEAILASLCAQLEMLGWSRNDIVVLSGNPCHTQAQHKTQAVSRYDAAAILRLLRQRPPVISGGGSLLQDTTSWRTIPYYLGLLEVARAFGCPTALYAQGVGPIHRRWFCTWAARAFRKAVASSVRDSMSQTCLLDWGLSGASVPVTADPVYGLIPKDKSQRNRQRMLVNLRPLKNQSLDLQAWRANLASWEKSGWQIGLLPLGPGDGEQLQMLIQERPWLQLEEASTLDQLLATMAQYDVVISMRLHGMIFAAVAGCLPLGVAYDPKVRAAAKQLQSGCVDPTEILTLQGLVADLWQRRNEQGLLLDQRVADLRKRAARNQAVLEAVAGRSR